MKYIFAILLASLFALPAIVSAHALPVSSDPASAEVLDSAPAEISIKFSEHIDPSASVVKVTDSGGRVVSGKAHLDTTDTRMLRTPVEMSTDGTYLVSWSVVSSDDGHFTRGVYPFAVGPDQVITDEASGDVEIVQLATAPEAFASAVELLGHGFLWAVLLLFAFAARPLLLKGNFEKEAIVIRRGYGWFISIGAGLAIAGGTAQILIKARQLADLQSLELGTALTTYIGTAAGAATMYRMIAIAAFMVIFLVARKKIVFARRFSLYEAGLLLMLVAFAFFRAKISHATPNQFHPDLSIFINFLHLIEKDIWAGITAILVLLALSKRMRRFLDAVISRAFEMLAIDLAAVSATAAYIIWLHLKSFENIFSTQWGSVFLELMFAATFLVALRTYHVVARIRWPGLFARILPTTLAAECALAIMVVYCSSVVIITSPPLAQPPLKVFSSTDQSVRITLTQDRYEDGQLLLTDSGGDTTGEPTVTVLNTEGDTLSVPLSQRFAGGYVFPLALLSGKGPFQVEVIVPHSGGYDAHALFSVTSEDLTVPAGWERHRSVDMFTLMMTAIALIVVLFAAVLFRLSRVVAASSAPPHRQVPVFAAVPVFLLVLFATTSILSAFHGSSLQNPFAARCVADGNEWHVMLPTIAGVPTSNVPAEGCMWGMGRYMYMFPDRRIYDYYSGLGPATVTLRTEPSVLRAGVPTDLVVSLKNADGSPATLFIDMEKIAHMVVISADQSVFAHLHADDSGPIPASDRAESKFTFKYTFPRSGDYLIAVDYAHGTVLESRQFKVHVDGGPLQEATTTLYPTQGTFGGYRVALDYPQPQAGKITTIKYTITKDGAPVSLVPYLSAAMHVAVVKNDFSWYLHVHGEYHVPGTPLPALSIKNGQVLHTMAMMVTPQRFTGPIESHVVFPSAGTYTVWGQFKTEHGEIVATSFTVRVEQ